MDDINIASTIQGQYNGLAQQADARARAGYYSSLSASNQANMPIQAQDAANRNAAYQQSLQSGQMDLDEKKQQQADSQFVANAFMKNHSTTTDAPAQTPSAPITSAGPVKPQPQPQVQAPGLSSLLNPNALTANQSQVMQGQNPTPSPVDGMATPASGTLKSPFPPVSEADLLGHLKGAVQTSASQNPMAEGISSTMAKIPNGSDTTSAVGDNPHFAATHTYDSVNPTTGQITHNTFNRQSYHDELASNPRTAGLAAQLESQWTAQDAGDQLTKAQAQVAKTSQLLGMVSSVANAAPEHQQAAFNFMLQQAEKQGLDVSSLKGTDLSTPEGQAKLDYLNKAAQADAATGAANLAVAKNTTDRLKANSEIGLQGAQASEIPSKIGLNNANIAKAYADAAKTKQEAATAVQAGGPLNDAVVQSYVDGHMSLTPMTLRTPWGQNLYSAIIAKDPTWTMNRAETRKNMTTGPVGKTADALNTAPVHIDDWVTAMQAQQNGSFTPGNALYNKWAGILGSDKPVTTNAIKDAVSDEIAGSLKQSGATDTSIKAQQENFKNAASPDQAMAVGKAAMGVLRDKLNIYQEKYRRDNPTDTGFNLIQPTTAAIFNKYGVVPNPGGLAQTTTSGQPAGASHPAAPQMQDGTVSASGKFIWHGGWVAR